MAKLIVPTLGVWLLTLYPVAELSRVIVVWRKEFAPKSAFEMDLEMGLIWVLYLAIPVWLSLANKVSKGITKWLRGDVYRHIRAIVKAGTV